MLLLAEALFLAELVLLVYCVFAIVKTPAEQVRLLPKAAWLVLVVLLPLVGGIGWLLAGRPAAARPAPGQQPARPLAPAPDDDEAFLQALRDRVQAQREAARQQEDREREDRERQEREQRRRREGPAPTSEGTGG